MITKEEIIQVLSEEWNIKPAADKLGVGYSTLRKYIKEYGIDHNSRKKQDRSALFNRTKWQSEKVTEFRRKRKLDSLEYLGGMKCNRCGYNKPIPAVYSFHHIDPSTKDPNFSKMKSNGTKWEDVKAELDKCIVLCHNCHAEVHWEHEK